MPTSDVELGLAALTVACDLLADRRSQSASIGWWPECGRAQVAPVDRRLLERTIESVVDTVTMATRRRHEPMAA